jgi:hypothetical protein
MPPKNDKKEREKVIEDKTFGMKNKNKSAKVQKYIQGLKASATSEPKVSKERADAELRAKKDQAEKAALLSSIFGVQPTKKKKKQAEDKGKVDLYMDLRAQKTATKDPATGEYIYTWTAPANQTEIVCKFYLEAVQNSQLGWMWQCPNGDQCIYRHCLPEGYVLATGQGVAVNEEDEDNEPIPIEEQVELERARLVTEKLTPVTEESFLSWLNKKKQEKLEKDKEEAAKNKVKKDLRIATTGRDLFVMDPSLFVDEEDALDEFERDLDYRLSDADEGEQQELEHQLRLLELVGEEGEEEGEDEEEEEADE